MALAGDYGSAMDRTGSTGRLLEAVYRLVQEALTNVGKHARTDRVEIEVEHHGGDMRLRVADDGRGFDATEPASGFELAGMGERVALLGGAFEVTTSDHGTVIAAGFPV